MLEFAGIYRLELEARISLAATRCSAGGGNVAFGAGISDDESRHYGRRPRRASEAAHPDFPQAAAPGREPVGPPDPDRQSEVAGCHGHLPGSGLQTRALRVLLRRWLA